MRRSCKLDPSASDPTKSLCESFPVETTVNTNDTLFASAEMDLQRKSVGYKSHLRKLKQQLQDIQTDICKVKDLSSPINNSDSKFSSSQEAIKDLKNKFLSLLRNLERVLMQWFARKRLFLVYKQS